MSNNQGRRRPRPQQRNRPKANGHRPAAPEQNGQPAEMPDINTNGRELSDEKVVLFKINGHAYEVPAELPQSMVMDVIHEMRTRGELFGLDLAMELLLGKDDYKRYRQVVDYLDDEDDEAISKAVESHLIGAMENRTGKA